MKSFADAVAVYMNAIQYNRNKVSLKLTATLLAFLFILIPSSYVIAEEATTTTTIYPSKYYNSDGTTATKHIFSNGAEVGTVTGSGSEAIPRYVHTDNLTGSNVITNSSGTIDETLDYYPFGGIRIDSGTYSNQRKFAGSEFDSGTGLNYMNARYYNSATGRFLSEDQEFWNMNSQYLLDPQQWNSYSYARNNPLKYIDPNGEKVELVGRSVTKKIGAHFFLHITPDNPDQIKINGLPARTDEFTLGAYNPNPVNIFGNKLEKDIGFEGHESGDYPLTRLNIRGSVEISPPEGQTDSDLINNLGKAYDTYNNDVNYNMFGNWKGFYNGNSNTFINEIGSQAGVGDQVRSFNPAGANPGYKDRLPTTSIYREIKRKVNQVSNKVKELVKNKVKK